MIRFRADWFDGESARARKVDAETVGDRLRLVGDGTATTVALADLTVQPPAGRAAGIVQLGAAGELHSADTDALTRLAALCHRTQPERLAAHLERRIVYALAALLVAIGIGFAGLRWGVPALARGVVERVPVSYDKPMGERGLAVLDHFAFKPSTLPAARRIAIEARLAGFCARHACPEHTLLFRDGGRIGPNAMALPGGIVVVTDQLVELAQHDDEVLAVLLHELGHVEHRHGLRIALQSVGAGLLLVAVTGDLDALTDLGAGLPALLLQNGYSRDMEREADAYALAGLNADCIPPARFTALLERLAKGRNGETGLLDSHPGIIERLAPFRAAPAPGAGCA